MKVLFNGDGDLCTNARPQLVMTAGDSDDAQWLARFAALVARGVNPNRILADGIPAVEKEYIL